jgi:hypothetical protein
MFLLNEEGFGEVYMGGLAQVRFEQAGVVSLDGRALSVGNPVGITCQLRQFYTGLYVGAAARISVSLASDASLKAKRTAPPMVQIVDTVPIANEVRCDRPLHVRLRVVWPRAQARDAGQLTLVLIANHVEIAQRSYGSTDGLQTDVTIPIEPFTLSCAHSEPVELGARVVGAGGHRLSSAKPIVLSIASEPVQLRRLPNAKKRTYVAIRADGSVERPLARGLSVRAEVGGGSTALAVSIVSPANGTTFDASEFFNVILKVSLPEAETGAGLASAKGRAEDTTGVLWLNGISVASFDAAPERQHLAVFAGLVGHGTHWLQTALISASTHAPLAISPAVAVRIDEEAELVLESPTAGAEYEERTDMHVVIAGYWRPAHALGTQPQAAVVCVRWNGVLLRTYGHGEPRVEHRLDVADLEDGPHEAVVSVEPAGLGCGVHSGTDPPAPFCSVTRRILVRRNITLAVLDF